MAWTYNPLILDLIQSLHLDPIVYHCVDDLAAAPRLPREQIESEEQRLAKSAKVVFVTSEPLRAKLAPFVRGLLRYYPNVADYAHFRTARDENTLIPEELLKIKNPRIGFIGAISGYKLDFELLVRAAELTPNWNWILIGKIGEGDPLTDASILKRNNIHLLGPKNYLELPGYMKGMDAMILPCPLNEYTKSMFPMKFFEYLAAGKLVVASDLPALRSYRESFAVAATAEETVFQLSRILSGEVKYTEKLDQLAQENTWETRLDRMLCDLETELGGQPELSDTPKLC